MAGELSPKKMSTYTDADSIADAGEKAYYKANAKFTTVGKMSAGDTGFSNYNLTLGNIAEGVADGSTITASNGKLSANVSVPVTDVTVGGTSVVNNGVAAVPAIPIVPVTDVTVGGTSVVSNGVAAVPAMPTVPVTDVTVDGTSVLNNGVAEITMPSVPTASSLAGTGLTVNASTNKVDVWLDNSTIGIIGSGGDAGKIGVKTPIPSVGNGHANVGKVLTVVTDDNTDSVAWADVPTELPAVGTSENRGKVLTVNSSDAVVWGTHSLPW